MPTMPDLGSYFQGVIAFFHWYIPMPRADLVAVYHFGGQYTYGALLMLITILMLAIMMDFCF